MPPDSPRLDDPPRDPERDPPATSAPESESDSEDELLEEEESELELTGVRAFFPFFFFLAKRESKALNRASYCSSASALRAFLKDLDSLAALAFFFSFFPLFWEDLLPESRSSGDLLR